MDFQKYFPVWDKLTEDQQNRLKNAVTPYEGKKEPSFIMETLTALVYC